MKGYETLRSYPARQSELQFSLNPSYETYLRIHKVLVGPATALQLEEISESLGQESLPRYLVAAGWAAAEASIAQPHRSAKYRNQLLNNAEGFWEKALQIELQLLEEEKDSFVEASSPYRIALDMARLPLLRGMVIGSITPATRQSVREETLSILDTASVQAHLALGDNNIESFNDLLGLMHEGSALAALDSFDSDSLFGMSSFARSDSGHYHKHQTHDLVIIQQKHGILRSMTPVEVKSKTSARDRERYKALLVRGKMHLCLPGKYYPGHTIGAFAALFNKNQTKQEKETTDIVRQTFIDMFWQYKCGPVLADIATNRSRLRFRDRRTLNAKYPEVAVPDELRELVV